MSNHDNLRIGILGASGYTGGELLRLLSRHPKTYISSVSAEKHAGKAVAEIFPQFGHLNLPILQKIDDFQWDSLDLVFCALPHGMTQELATRLPKNIKVIDLSADFRLRQPSLYQHWYGHPHRALDLQAQAVYGLSEVYRHEIARATLVACPGCYPTAAQLALIPLLKDGLIETTPIMIDAKSGISGAGRELKQNSLFCETTEGIHAYGVNGHRHMPEIEQGLSDAAGKPVGISFIPHLVPMSRGILETIYVRLPLDVTAIAIRECWLKTYKNSHFIDIFPVGSSPETRHVRGTNRCAMSVLNNPIPGYATILVTIDNLVKGASGQAIQNMNIMMGYPENLGLEHIALFP